MKKVLMILGLVLFNLSITAFGAESNVTAQTSPFEVWINQNNCFESGNYPALFYRNIVYIPMTYSAGECMERNIEWIDGYEQDILLITQKDTDCATKNTVSKNDTNPRQISAETVGCKIAVCNGEYINFIQGTKEYPHLRYNDIIYIPLTWNNVVEKFGWSFAFDETNGVHIDTLHSNITDKREKDIYISQDGSTICYIIERKKYIDTDGSDATDWVGLIRYNHDMTGKDLWCLNMGEFAIEKELSHPVKQGDVRFFKTYRVNEFTAPITRDFWTFLHSATTMMLDTRTGSINKWQALASWRQKEVKDIVADTSVISMSETDYVSDSISIINGENVDIELKSIPMQYVIKRVDSGRNEIILTYDVPLFPGGSLIVPKPTSTITKVNVQLPQWDFRDKNGEYVPEGEYEISLIVPDKVEYIADGKSIILENPKGVFINSIIKLVK